MNHNRGEKMRRKIDFLGALGDEAKSSTEIPHRCAFCREGRICVESSKNHVEELSKNLIIVIRDIPFLACNLCRHEYVSPEDKKALQSQVDEIKKNRSLARPIAAYQMDFQKL